MEGKTATWIIVCKVVALHVVFHNDGKAVCKATTLHTIIQVAVYVEREYKCDLHMKAVLTCLLTIA